MPNNAPKRRAQAGMTILQDVVIIARVKRRRRLRDVEAGNVVIKVAYPFE